MNRFLMPLFTQAQFVQTAAKKCPQPQTFCEPNRSCTPKLSPLNCGDHRELLSQRIASTGQDNRLDLTYRFRDQLSRLVHMF